MRYRIQMNHHRHMMLGYIGHHHNQIDLHHILPFRHHHMQRQNQQLNQVQEQLPPQNIQPVQAGMQQQFRSTEEYKPIGMFGSSRDKMN